MFRWDAKLWVYLLVGAFMLVIVPHAGAEPLQTHSYDPVLSISESSEPDTEDPVPDPGPIHPSPRFQQPCGVVADPMGNIYISSPDLVMGSVVASRLDVFNAEGEFLTRVDVADNVACGLGVDSDGVVYAGGIEGDQIAVFTPSEYPLTVSTTYELAKSFDPEAALGCPPRAVAVDRSNDHFYLSGACRVLEYGSAAEGSPPNGEVPTVLGEIPGELQRLSGMDVYGLNHDIYTAVLRATSPGNVPRPSAVLVFDGNDGHVKCEVLSVDVPGGLEFGLGASVAIDQSTGDLYVYSIKQGQVYKFGAPNSGECEFLGTLPEPPQLKGDDPLGDIAVDAPIIKGEPAYGSPNEGYVYVTSGKSASTSHVFAYKPNQISSPEIKGQNVIDITEAAATLFAELNPGGLDASYHFEYTTQADFETNEYANAISVPVPDGYIDGSGTFSPISERIVGLKDGVNYRFRLVASNCESEGSELEKCTTSGEGMPGDTGSDVSFATYPAPPVPEPCPNAALRVQQSASLPDCRAYELVTPPDTGGHVPRISILGLGFGEVSFTTPPASATGNSVVFGSNSGALPGIGGGGFFDTYLASRTEVGWTSQFTGLSGAQAERPRPGGVSADHLYSFWNVEEGQGTFSDVVTDYAQYLRGPVNSGHSPNCSVKSEPEGRFEVIGCGNLAAEPKAAGRFISSNGQHVIFDTTGKSDPVQLETCAPPTGIGAIYDRVPGGPTHCISIPPANASLELEEEFETEDPVYKGTSADGTTVVFAVGDALYARLDNIETLQIAAGTTAFAGISHDGDRVFYLDNSTGLSVPQGEIYMCELGLGSCGAGQPQQPVQIGSGGESIMVNVSSDGSRVYFISQKSLGGEESEEGESNFYTWNESVLEFIGVLDPLDIEDVSMGQGLGRWVTSALSPRPTATIGIAQVPARSTSDGKVLVFESRANLTNTSYDDDGHLQVFRYESEATDSERLICVSCNPTGGVAASDARLQIPQEGQLVSTNPSPVNAISSIANVSADGAMVFFQSRDRLVSRDLDGKLDVYEWETEKTGGCDRNDGCLSLISYGRSTADDYLYAMTPDGQDVFFLSGDTLASEDPDGIPSIYDARIAGGFPSAIPSEDACLDEACQPAVVAPTDLTPASSTFEGPGDPRKRGRAAGRPCPRGKHKVAKNGRARCVKRRQKKQGRQRGSRLSSAGGRAAR